jgi:hypothetical protein
MAVVLPAVDVVRVAVAVAVKIGLKMALKIVQSLDLVSLGQKKRAVQSNFCYNSMIKK